MYLMINGNKHTVSRRIVKSNEIRYLTVTPEPETISGTIQMFDNNGFMISEDNADTFLRSVYAGTLLILTNVTESTDKINQPTLEQRVCKLESSNEEIENHLAEADEIAIELYEANMLQDEAIAAQDQIIAAQDDALIELYELIGGN